MDRRQFVTSLIASGAVVAVPSSASAARSEANRETRPQATSQEYRSTEVDFRYAPHHPQATICFPDDPCKSIMTWLKSILEPRVGKSFGISTLPFRNIGEEVARKQGQRRPIT